ncbi:AI-2E family transporter [Streptomyces xantholiticus]
MCMPPRSPDPQERPSGAPSTAETSRVPDALRTAAAYAWRILVVAAAVYAVFALLGRFHEIAVAVFLGLVVTAVLRPVAGSAARIMPRPLAVACSLLGSIVLVLGVFALVGEAVAGERTTLVREFRAGIERIESWLERPPFRVDPEALTDIQHLLHPIVMSWAVRLHPVVVALSVVGGAVAAGVVGAVAAVPLVAVVWSVRQALRAARPSGGEG